jgi:hypothetical protein
MPRRPYLPKGPMPPTARPLALIALGLGLGLWVSPPIDAFSTMLAAAPTLLGLALWAVTGRAFGPPPRRWNSLTLGLASLVAAGAVGGGLLFGLSGAVDSYAHQRQTDSPYLAIVWRDALIFWAGGAFLGAAFGLVFGAGAALGVRSAGAALAAPSAKKPVAAYATAGATAAWLLFWEIAYDLNEQLSSTGLADTYPPSPAFRLLGAALTVAAALGAVAALRAPPSRASALRAAGCALVALASTLVSYHCLERHDQRYVETWSLVSSDITGGPLSPQTRIAVEPDLWGQTLVVRQPGGAPRRTRLSFGPFRIDRADELVASMRRDAAGD